MSCNKRSKIPTPAKKIDPDYSRLENYTFNDNSNTKDLDRRYYFTKLTLKVPNLDANKDIVFRLDTGSAYTIISMRDIIDVEEIKDDSGNVIELRPKTSYDAKIRNMLLNITEFYKEVGSANSLKGIKLRKIVVDDFRLTDKIIFPKLEIFLSDSLTSTSILGMDILTLFKFTYVPSEKEITLFHYPDYLERFHKVMGDASKDYISPYCIALIDDVDLYSEKEQENDASEPIQSAYSEKILSDAEVIEEVFRYPAADE